MDGEDFELLFTTPPSVAARLPREIAGVPLTEIGVVVGRGASVTLRRGDGSVVPLRAEGFHHFATPRRGRPADGA
jgi:thiamine monophosphate kinase